MFIDWGDRSFEKPSKRGPKPRKRIKPRSEKGRKLKKDEYEFFQRIWSERPHISEISGKVIPGFDTRCFSHILTKKAFPKLRLVSLNIVLCLPEEHRDWEDGKRDDPKWDWKKQLGEFLKTKNKNV